MLISGFEFRRKELVAREEVILLQRLTARAKSTAYTTGPEARFEIEDENKRTTRLLVRKGGSNRAKIMSTRRRKHLSVEESKSNKSADEGGP